MTPARAAGKIAAIMSTRRQWLDTLLRIAMPVLSAASEGRLRRDMPVEAWPGQEAHRRRVSHLEALARTLAGIAPWLALAGPEIDEEENALRRHCAALAVSALRHALAPDSADRMDFVLPDDPQPLVEAAFLATALLRAPGVLWAGLDAEGRQHLLAALRSTRGIRPYENNWVLFPAMVETALHSCGGDGEWPPVRRALRAFRSWYLGDGTYGDGPLFQSSYYNSLVIQPMLLTLAASARDRNADMPDAFPQVLGRAQRHAETLERMISPDGTFPPLGRSLAYRSGAFHLLAQLAWRKQLPASLPATQVRCALTEVIRRTLQAPGTFDAGGWLTIGLAGHQPAIGEPYISTGSLYLCTAAFLPLGLPAGDPFWTDPDAAWTSRLAFDGRPFPIDTGMA